MAFPEALRESIYDQFSSRDTTLQPLEIPEKTEPGYQDFTTFLRATNILVKGFRELDTPQMRQLRTRVLSDLELRDVCGNVDDMLAWRVEVMLAAIATGELDISFGGRLQHKSSDDDPKMVSAQSLQLGYRIDGKGTVELAYSFPEATAIEISLSEEAKREFFAGIVSLAWIVSEVRQNPDRFKLDPNQADWKIADGPTGLISLGVEKRNAFSKIMKEGIWDGWKSI